MIPDNVSFIISDTETTGKEDNDRICEVGWVRVDENLNILEQVESLIDPEQLIAPAASGVHGLTNADVAGAPTIEEYFSLDHPACYGHRIDEPVVLAGHRITFDHKRLAPFMPNVVQELCTLRWTRLLYPDCDNHQLSTLIFALGLPRSEGAHRVMADVMTCYHLIRHLCERTGMNIRQLAEASANPFPIKYMAFGKHKGKLLTEIDRGYLRWMLANLDLDTDLKYSVESALNNKKKKNEHTAGADA